jgi:hypothetical protein
MAVIEIPVSGRFQIRDLWISDIDSELRVGSFSNANTRFTVVMDTFSDCSKFQAATRVDPVRIRVPHRVLRRNVGSSCVPH